MTPTELEDRALELTVALCLGGQPAGNCDRGFTWHAGVACSRIVRSRFVRTPLMGRGPTKAAARKQLYFRIWAFLHFVERITGERNEPDDD